MKLLPQFSELPWDHPAEDVDCQMSPVSVGIPVAVAVVRLWKILDDNIAVILVILCLHYREFSVASFLIIICMILSGTSIYFIYTHSRRIQKIYEAQLISLIQLESSCAARRGGSVSNEFLNIVFWSLICHWIIWNGQLDSRILQLIMNIWLKQKNWPCKIN